MLAGSAASGHFHFATRNAESFTWEEIWMRIVQGNKSPHPRQREPSGAFSWVWPCLPGDRLPLGIGMGYTGGWTQWRQAHVGLLPTVTTRSPGCGLCAHQHLSASIVCLRKQRSGCRAALQRGTWGPWQAPSWSWSDTAWKHTGIPGCMRRTDSRSREVTLPLCSALPCPGEPQLEH